MMPKRTILQDRDITQITSDTKTKRIYIEFHFVTTEFDYATGRAFVIQFLAHLERIAPHDAIHATRDPQPPSSHTQTDAQGDWVDGE